MGHRQEDGSIVFRDNYLAVRFRHEMAAFISDAANAVFGETIIFYRVSAISTLSPDLPANATFEEYSTDAESRIFADIVLREEQFEGILAEEFALKFQNAGIISIFNIYVVSDDVFRTSADISLINPPIDPIEARQVARVNSNPTEIRVDLRGE